MSEGEVVVDFSGLSKGGMLKEGVHLKFSRGRLVGVDGGKEADDLRFTLAGVDFNAKVLGTIGFGTNHCSPRKSKQITEDRNLLGTLSVGLGDNRHLKGKNVSNVYVEAYARKACLRIDGQEIIVGGEIKIHLKDL
jgi:leucyl aminopeptidase (aminopeptidase T)